MIEVIVTIFAMTFIVIIVIGMVWSSIKDTLASFEELVINYQVIINQRLIRIEQAHSDGVVEGGVLPERREVWLGDMVDDKVNPDPNFKTISREEIQKIIDERRGMTHEEFERDMWAAFPKEEVQPVTDSVDRVVKLPKVGYPQTHPIAYPVRTDVVVKAVEPDGTEHTLEPGDVLGTDPKRDEVCPRCVGAGIKLGWVPPGDCPDCKGTGRLDGTKD